MEAGPARTCVGCRTRRRQVELIRVASRRGGTISVDPRRAEGEPASGLSPRGALAGRGAYLCVSGLCLERALSSGRLVRALRASELPQDVVEELRSRTAEGPPHSDAGARSPERGR